MFFKCADRNKVINIIKEKLRGPTGAYTHHSFLTGTSGFVTVNDVA